MKIKGKKVTFQVINIRGLTKTKYSEIENTFFGKEAESINFLCLTETQQKYEKVKVHKDLQSYSAMRVRGDKKGGVIQVIHP